MNARLREFVALAGTRRSLRLAALTLAAAASEGLGLALLVPLLGVLLAGTATSLPFLGAVPGAPWLLGGFVALVALRAVVEGARALAAQEAAAAIVDGLRERTMAALLAAEWRYLAGLSRSEQRALIVGLLDRAGEALHHLVALLRTGALLAMLALAAALIDWRTGLVAGVVGLAVLALARSAGRRARRLGTMLGQQYRALDRHVDDTLAAVRTLKSHGGEAQARAALSVRLAALRTGERAFLRHGAVMRGALQVVAAILLAAFVAAAMARGTPAPAILLAYVALALRCVPLLEALQASWQGWHHASPALAEIAALEQGARAAAEPRVGEGPAPRLTRELAFEGVTVRHPDGGGGLDAITLTIPAGALVVVTGASGAGKSTLADCAGGLRAPDVGKVTVDGVPLDGSARIAWRAHVAYAEQSPVLLAATIRENLLLACPDADEARLEAALAAASAQFVAALPQGLDTPVGDGGRVLSGGERQRLALARALLRQPDLLVLDEATSALDPATDGAIAAALRGLKGRTTVLIIAHRGALSEVADLRFRLENGRLNGWHAQNSP